MHPRLLLAARCVGAGSAIAFSMPPWGWWPLAFVGIALLDRLIADQPARVRFRRTWLVAATWLAVGMLWMLDLTAPGYVVAVAVYAAMFGAAAAGTPPGRLRWLVLPGAFVLAEVVRWSWPFGGVPLATLAMSQADAPLAPTVRLLGPLLLVALVVTVGVAVSAAYEQHRAAALAALGVVVVAWAGAAVAPRGEAFGEIDVAVVQGGGEQRTRFSQEEAPKVFERHLAASELIEGPVDLVLWPENVVNPSPPEQQRNRFEETAAEAAIQDLARRLDALVLPGWFLAVDDEHNVNFTNVYAPDGTELDRYDKVRTVPFGEFVPLRGLIERFAEAALPSRDVMPGDGPAVLDTPFGRLGIAISWEVFFDTRARDAMVNDATLLLNPTNGSSYWLTIVQTQQIASSRLRALETGRWVVQAAPTGFSAVIRPDGSIVERTALREQRVIETTVELRTGDTLATRVGRLPMIALAFALVAVGWRAPALMARVRPRAAG